MKKILIWDINFVLKPQGGPSGYLYNIKNEVEKLSKNRNIYFLRDLITQNEQIPFSKEKNRSYKVVFDTSKMDYFYL